jgi:hypothetical protein
MSGLSDSKRVKMVVSNIIKSIIKSRNKLHDKVYIAIDLHDTIIRSTYSAESESEEFYPHAKDVLQSLSKTCGIILILWTSSYPEKMKDVFAWFDRNEIAFKYLNENPECQNTEFGDFSKKFFYDILLDDKAGFTPESDWEQIHKLIMQCGDENLLDFVYNNRKVGK